MNNRYKFPLEENVWYQAMYYDQPLKYQITIDGKIRSQYSRAMNKVLGNHINSWGYVTWRLRKDTKTYHRLAHTIMAHTFLTLPEGYTYDNLTVNHIDGIKKNNHISNLEWCTFKANNLHKFDYELQLATRGPVDNNIYLFKNDDGREFIGTSRQLFHKFKESDRLFQQGLRNMIRGFNLTNGWQVTQHKGWRKLELLEETDERIVEKVALYKPIP